MDYKTHGVCSSMIHVELDGDKIKDSDFAQVILKTFTESLS